MFKGSDLLVPPFLFVTSVTDSMGVKWEKRDIVLTDAWVTVGEAPSYRTYGQEEGVEGKYGIGSAVAEGLSRRWRV